MLFFVIKNFTKKKRKRLIYMTIFLKNIFVETTAKRLNLKFQYIYYYGGIKPFI